MLVVLDPIVIVNTVRAPDGLSAKLLTLLAYGRARWYLEGGADAAAESLSQQPDSNWQRVQDSAYSNTEQTYRQLEDAIPDARGMREPWWLAVSFPLFDEVVRRVGQQNDVKINGETLVATVATHVFHLVRDSWPHLPDYTGTGDRPGNVSIHTALLARADLLVSRSRDVCPSGHITPYSFLDSAGSGTAIVPVTQPPPQLQAWPLDSVVHSLQRQGVDFDGIDASVLERIAPTGKHRAGEWRRAPEEPPPVLPPQTSGGRVGSVRRFGRRFKAFGRRFKATVSARLESRGRG